MKVFSGFARFLKAVIGWLMLLIFGVTGVYALFDELGDDPAVVVICLLLAAAGLLLIRSAHKDKKKEEAARAEETQYRRRQAEEENARSRQERQAAIPYVAVECPGCGAVARVRKGGVARCEYCDTPLEGK